MGTIGGLSASTKIKKMIFFYVIDVIINTDLSEISIFIEIKNT